MATSSTSSVDTEVVALDHPDDPDAVEILFIVHVSERRDGGSYNIRILCWPDPVDNLGHFYDATFPVLQWPLERRDNNMCIPKESSVPDTSYQP